MDIGLMLKQAWQVTWQHKFLWVPGFFAGLTGLSVAIARLFLGTRVTAIARELLAWAEQPQPAPFPFTFDYSGADLLRFSIEAVVVFLVIFLLFWVIATIAEASIIQVVVSAERGEAIGLGASLRAGFHWLGRFVAIDAAVFFPWFVLALIIMLVLLVMILLIGYMAFSNVELSTMFAVLGIGSLCLIPLFILLLPVAWVSFIYRTIAFRDAVWLDHGVKESVRHTWQVVRGNLGTAVLIALLMVAVQSMAGWVLDLLSLPIFGALAFLGEDSLLRNALGVGVVLVTAVFSGVVYTYVAVAWTISYKQLTENREQLTGNEA